MIRSSRRGLGVTPQETGLPPSLRVGEVVDFVRAHYPDPLGRDEILDRFGLTDLVKRQTGGLSGGQKRRVAVALAFVGRPRIVFLDEPTTGLDVEARRALWDGVRAFHADGGTVVLTSHYLEEIEALAERVVVIGGGRVLADDTVDAVRGLVAIRRVSLTSRVPLPDLPGVVGTERDGDRLASDDRRRGPPGPRSGLARRALRRPRGAPDLARGGLPDHHARRRVSRPEETAMSSSP